MLTQMLEDLPSERYPLSYDPSAPSTRRVAAPAVAGEPEECIFRGLLTAMTLA